MKTNKKTDRKLIKQLLSLVDYLLSKAEDYDDFRTNLVYEIYKLIINRNRLAQRIGYIRSERSASL